tara:strand:- start:100 stop:381 length:282 start_codon:yes stop_codon:yes gene_type:complete
MILKEEREILFQEIEKKYEVKEFLMAVDANVHSPDERELDMLWRWLLNRKDSVQIIIKGKPITAEHLAIYMRYRQKDDWYSKFLKKQKTNGRT